MNKDLFKPVTPEQVSKSIAEFFGFENQEGVYVCTMCNTRLDLKYLDIKKLDTMMISHGTDSHGKGVLQ